MQMLIGKLIMDSTIAPINLAICLKIANNNKEIASKLISMFIKELPEAQKDINKEYENNDFIELKKHVHKLLGSSAYCGASLIQRDLNEISKHAIDNNNEKLKLAVESLNINISKTMDFYRENTNIDQI